MPITKDTVEYVAHLARIDLQAKELEKLSRQLEEIVIFIDRFKELDLKGVSAASHILPIHNVLREDAPRPGLCAEKALQCAPQKEGNFFAVPKVIE
ncbi:MAG: Asp-tRNA(Asn)/Glu-tRNA(Gln) amidotransferase subunit GatC [Candidatus Omnitrophica bacterium]|nr:Asp-tRNA(Asn)/Glu-tRNA(Gln) amidotransferase subunit GatC [Candidatus Omnitrophota bacterium]